MWSLTLYSTKAKLQVTQVKQRVYTDNCTREWSRDTLILLIGTPWPSYDVLAVKLNSMEQYDENKAIFNSTQIFIVIKLVSILWQIMWCIRSKYNVTLYIFYTKYTTQSYNRRHKDKLDTPRTNIHDHSLSSFFIGISIKRGGVKQIKY
jgi:hypothetical protein